MREENTGRRGPLGARAICVAAWLLAFGAVAQTQAPAPGPQPTPATPRQVVEQPATDVHINENPDDPMASREVRLERARKLMERRIAERDARLKQEAEAAAAKAAGTAAPGAPGALLPGQSAAPAPGATPTPKPTPPAQASQPHVTMFMSPASHSVRVGEQFPTHWRLANPDHLVFDRIQLAMHFPAENVRPVSVHQEALEGLLEGEPELLLDEAAGALIYRASFKEPLRPSELALVTVLWEAVAPARVALIRPSVGSEQTSAWWGDKRQTVTIYGMDDALVGANVQILGEQPAVPKGYQILTSDPRDLAPVLAGFPDQTRLRPPSFWIEQDSRAEYAAGDWVVIDVGITNGDDMVFDEIRLALRYDPQVLHVVDTDGENLIRRGTNILDGPFHATWGWDHYYTNEVDAARGLIQYRVSTSDLAEQPSGPLARVFARVLKPARGPLLSWHVGAAGSEREATTGVYLLGRSLHADEVSMAAGAQVITADERGAASNNRRDRARQAAMAAAGIEKAPPGVYRERGAGRAGVKAESAAGPVAEVPLERAPAEAYRGLPPVAAPAGRR